MITFGSCAKDGMSKVFWDTNLFIYLLEDKGQLSENVAALRKRMLERGDQLFTSSLTLGEILVKPIESGDEVLSNQYEKLLSSAATILPFGNEAARQYAAIRRDRTIRPPDAIQLACAAQANMDLFITNDDRLSRKVVSGIHFVSSLGNVPL
jgi:predicted nucleic acid-binding protein